MKRIATISVAAILAILHMSLVGCAATEKLAYEGDDAGYVVVGIGARAGTEYSAYKLIFRRIGNEESDRFVYFQRNMFYSEGNDYESGAETGVVNVRKLAPGEYEINNVDIFFNNGYVQKNFYLPEDISIPFTVAPGEVTYLGNFQANKVTGENVLGMTLPAGAFFVVTDREEDDIRIAEQKHPDIEGKVVQNEFSGEQYESLPNFRLTSAALAK